LRRQLQQLAQLDRELKQSILLEWARAEKVIATGCDLRKGKQTTK
jgi:hypothetical protein